jgi:hypothetical protein
VGSLSRFLSWRRAHATGSATTDRLRFSLPNTQLLSNVCGALSLWTTVSESIPTHRKPNTGSFDSGLCTPKNQMRVLGDPAYPALNCARYPSFAQDPFGAGAPLWAVGHQVKQHQGQQQPQGPSRQKRALRTTRIGVQQLWHLSHQF